MDKWYAILGCVFAISVFGSMALENYYKNKCTEVALQAGKSTEEITKICVNR